MEPNDTTATLRERARKYAAELKWALAANAYQAAYDRYPTNGGALADMDKAALLRQAENCRYMAQQEQGRK